METMEKVKVEKIEDFKSFVDSLEVNKVYILPSNFRYEWLKIEKESEWNNPNEIYYTWSMEYRYRISGSVGYIYPLSGNMVKHFKTEKGAKRNFFNQYSRYFESVK